VDMSSGSGSTWRSRSQSSLLQSNGFQSQLKDLVHTHSGTSIGVRVNWSYWGGVAIGIVAGVYFFGEPEVVAVIAETTGTLAEAAWQGWQQHQQWNQLQQAAPNGYALAIWNAQRQLRYPRKMGGDTVIYPAQNMPSVPAGACALQVARVHAAWTQACNGPPANTQCRNTMLGVAQDTNGAWWGAYSGAEMRAPNIGQTCAQTYNANGGANNNRRECEGRELLLNVFANLAGGNIAANHVIEAKPNLGQRGVLLTNAVNYNWNGVPAVAFQLNGGAWPGGNLVNAVNNLGANDGVRGTQQLGAGPAEAAAPVGNCAGTKLVNHIVHVANLQVSCLAEMWYAPGGNPVTVRNSNDQPVQYPNGEFVPSCITCQGIIQPMV